MSWRNSRLSILASWVATAIGLILILLTPGLANAAPPKADKPDNGGHFKVDKPDPSLTAKWWQTYVALPASTNPFDRCDLGTGKVVFLAGSTPGGEATPHRSCTTSKDKTFLVPLINVECSQAENDPPPFEICAKNFADKFTNLSLVIDGQAVPNLNGLRVASGGFTFTSVAGNIFKIPPFTNSESASDGYWALIKLTPGKHTITFGGEGRLPNGDPFTIGPITYDLLVKK